MQRLKLIPPLVLVPALLVVACGGGGSTTSSAQPTAPTDSTPAITAVRVTGTTPLVGSSEQFRATASLSDNSSQQITTEATWQSSNPSVATVSAGGVATGVGSGDTDISATYHSVTGSVRVTITDTPPVLSEPVVDLSGAYDSATKRLGALDCNFEFVDSPDDRWCFNAFASTAIPGKQIPSFDYKVAPGSVVVAATAGIVVEVAPHEQDGMFPGEFAINTKSTPDSPYLVQYDHVKNLTVTVGSLVAPGTKLGTAGVLRPNSRQSRVEMQISKLIAVDHVIQAINVCPSTFGTPRFNQLNEAALAAHNSANPRYAQPSVCLLGSVPALLAALK